jgi:hypothetical protein
VPDDDIGDYEVSVLAEILQFCEEYGQPCIHDSELTKLPSGKNLTIIRDFLQKLYLKDYLDQNSWTESGTEIKGERVCYWWCLTGKAMARLQALTPTPAAVDHPFRPGWIRKLPDTVLQGILNEVYEARAAGLLMLPLVGARTAFDRAMFVKIGDPGGFGQKLEEMKKKGLLDERGYNSLKPMIDAGNAAAHRGWTPTREILDDVITEVEHQLRDWFIRDAAVSRVRGAVPSRLPRGKPKPSV